MAYTGNTLVIHDTRHTKQNERSIHNATTHDNKKTPWHRKQSGAACCNDSSAIGRVTANMLARSEAIKGMKRERFVVPQADMRVSRGKGV